MISCPDRIGRGGASGHSIRKAECRLSEKCLSSGKRKGMISYWNPGSCGGTDRLLCYPGYPISISRISYQIPAKCLFVTKSKVVTGYGSQYSCGGTDRLSCYPGYPISISRISYQIPAKYQFVQECKVMRRLWGSSPLLPHNTARHRDRFSPICCSWTSSNFCNR